MEENDSQHATWTTIQDLPFELILEILKWIELESDLDSVQEVCSLWYSIIDERIGRAVHHPGSPYLSNYGLDVISEIGVNALYIDVHNRSLLESPIRPFPLFKLPYLLQCLRLRAQIHPDLFMNLVKDSINLSELSVTFDALSHTRNEDLLQLNFPRLKKLIVQCAWNREDDALADLPKLHTLLREGNRFPWLATLNVEVPVKSFPDLETFKVLIPFIHRHHALREISILIIFPRNFVKVYVTPYLEELNSIISDIKRKESCRSLKSVRIDGRNLREGYPQLDICREFLMKQSTLQDVGLRIGTNLNDVLMLRSLIYMNMCTLTKLIITVPTESEVAEGRQVDLSSFSVLQSLHTLRLRTSREITGTRYLPPTLVEIALWGIVRSDGLAHILLELPNLQKVYLVLVDVDREEYGVTFDTLQQCIQNRKVDSLFLDGIRDGFPPGGIPNGDPLNPKNVTVCWQGCAWLKLNSDGYYTCAPSAFRR